MFRIYPDPIIGWRLKVRGLPSMWAGTRADAINLISLMWDTQAPATSAEQRRDAIAYLSTFATVSTQS